MQTSQADNSAKSEALIRYGSAAFSSVGEQ